MDSLSVTDSTSEEKLRKIVSLAEDTDKVSSLEAGTHTHTHLMTYRLLPNDIQTVIRNPQRTSCLDRV